MFFYFSPLRAPATSAVEVLAFVLRVPPYALNASILFGAGSAGLGKG